MENREVLFPEPVGPVNKTMPWGRVRACSTCSKLVPQSPNSSRTEALEDSFKIRMATFSPSTIGKVLTLSAYCPLPICTLKRPSCGARRSSILRLDKILIRLTSADRTFLDRKSGVEG